MSDLEKFHPEKPDSIRSARQVMQDASHSLKRVLSKARQLAEIEALVHEFVPKEIRVGSYEGNTLTLITPNGAAATSIRYREQNIISALRQKINSQTPDKKHSEKHGEKRGEGKQTGLDVKQIKVLVRPETGRR